jgi:hypothetical protein
MGCLQKGSEGNSSLQNINQTRVKLDFFLEDLEVILRGDHFQERELAFEALNDKVFRRVFFEIQEGLRKDQFLREDLANKGNCS